MEEDLGRVKYSLSNRMLSNLTCKICSKVLSVLPVTAFSKGKYACGRCTNRIPEGSITVKSFYNKIAERNLFKCVNVFDGCREILRTTQVRKHEEICQTHYHNCPICGAIIPTFAMINHFKKKHKDSYLETSYFNMKYETGTDKCYLYNFEDDLFVIFVKDTLFLNPEGSSLVLTTYCLRDIKYKISFDILHDDVHIKTKLDCASLYSIDNQGSISLDVKRERNLMIAFSIEFEQVANVMLLRGKNVFDDSNDVVRAPRRTIPDYFERIFFQQRNIALGEKFFKRFPAASVTDGTLNLKIDGYVKKVSLTCRLCREINPCTFFNGKGKICFEYLCETFSAMCFYCAVLIKSHHHEVLSMRDVDKVSLTCVWRCGGTFPVNDLNSHETICEKQLLQQCPVDTCETYAGILRLERHLQEDHDMLPTKSAWICLDKSRPILQLHARVLHVFIALTCRWKEPSWEIRLDCKFPNVKPRAVIFAAGCVDFLTIIKERGKIGHIDKIEIKCYLADAETEQIEQKYLVRQMKEVFV